MLTFRSQIVQDSLWESGLCSAVSGRWYSKAGWLHIATKIDNRYGRQCRICGAADLTLYSIPVEHIILQNCAYQDH